jgi:hypothetical protein
MHALVCFHKGRNRVAGGPRQCFLDYARLMPKALTVSVDHKPDGTAPAKFSAYALALTATRQQGGRGELRQEAE